MKRNIKLRPGKRVLNRNVIIPDHQADDFDPDGTANIRGLIASLYLAPMPSVLAQHLIRLVRETRLERRNLGVNKRGESSEKTEGIRVGVFFLLVS